MAIVSIELFNKFQRMQDSDDTLTQQLIDTAEDIVKGYLKYDPSSQDYDSYLDGNDTSVLLLGAKPINSITLLTIDGATISEDDYIYRDEEIVLTNDDVFTAGLANVHIKYTAGFDVVPAVIKQTIIRIAGLLMSEDDGNIGVTSKSFDGGTSRTFFKTTNFDPKALLRKHTEASLRKIAAAYTKALFEN